MLRRVGGIEGNKWEILGWLIYRLEKDCGKGFLCDNDEILAKFKGNWDVLKSERTARHEMNINRVRGFEKIRGKKEKGNDIVPGRRIRTT